jgi:RNA-directed DNA polymerase
VSRGQYAATPVKRIWIEKENGKQRPIGIPAFENKVAQKAVEMILSAIYEPNFYNFSHYFRAGHSQHMAIKELREESIRTNTNWIVSANITGLFDNIDHDYNSATAMSGKNGLLGMEQNGLKMKPVR